MRDWLAMRPEEFDTSVEPGLFDVPAKDAPDPDPCGTGDLLESLADTPEN